MDRSRKNQPQLPKLNSVWFKRCKTEEEKEQIEQLVRNSTGILSLLQEIWKDEREYLLTNTFSDKEYESGNWAYKQADNNGRYKQNDKNLKLVSFLGD